MEQYDKAIDAYDRALRFSTGDVGEWTGKANVLFEPDRYDDALQCYEKALARDPSSIHALTAGVQSSPNLAVWMNPLQPSTRSLGWTRAT